MSEKTIVRRSLIPTAIALAITIISMLCYFNLRGFGNEPGFSVLIKACGLIYFTSVAFGTLFVFCISYIGGAPFKEQVLASFVTPFFWMTKEVIRLTESHPVSESLFWYANPLNVWLITLMILEMGIATLIARRVLQKRGGQIDVATRGPILTVIGSLIFVVLVYAWGKGENVYVIFLSTYRLLFGSGV